MRKIANYIYLFPNSKNYYLRFRYPSEIAQFLGKKYFCKSLGLSSLDDALFVARYIKTQIFKDLKYFKMPDFNSFLRQRFTEYKKIAEYSVSNGSLYPQYTEYKPLTTEDKTLFEEYVKSSVNPDDDYLFKMNHIAHRDQYDEYMNSYKNLSSEFDDVKAPAIDMIYNFANTELLFKERLILYIQELRKRHVNFESVLSNQEFTLDNEELFRDYTLSSNTFDRNLKVMDKCWFIRDEVVDRDALPLRETYQKFIAIKSKEVKVGTVVSYDGTIDFLLDFLGEGYDLRDLNKSEAIRIQEAVINKTLGTKKDSDETLSNKSINKFLNHYSALMNYLIDMEYIDRKNPFDGLKLKDTRQLSKTRRRPYTKEESKKVLTYEITSKREAKDIRNSAYWFPKIAFYTGMRLNEISELTVDDFRLSSGVYFIELYDKNLKNENSERRIPIHSKLIEYDILGYVEERRQAKSKYIFDDLRNRKKTKTIEKDGWGITASKWFNKNVFDNLEITKLENGKKLDFHAIRTTVLSHFKREGLSAYLVKQIAGHGKDDDVTFDDYGSEVNTKISELKRIIETIKY